MPSRPYKIHRSPRSWLRPSQCSHFHYHYRQLQSLCNSCSPCPIPHISQQWKDGYDFWVHISSTTFPSMPESQADSWDNYSNWDLALWKGSTNGPECLNYIPIGIRSIVTYELDIVTGRLTGYVLSYRTTVENLHTCLKFMDSLSMSRWQRLLFRISITLNIIFHYQNENESSRWNFHDWVGTWAK